jgi:cytochrome b
MKSDPMAPEQPARTAVASIPEIRVWDPVVRLFHWTLALGCILNLTLLREIEPVHHYVGYAVLGALTVRVLWGFVGTPHGRFSDFVVGPRRLASYLRKALNGNAPRYVGHNPAGGLMMLLLMVLAAAAGVSGWMMQLDPFWGEEWVEDLHEAAANAILLLAIVHIVAALVESWHHRENLIKAMITGRKRAASGTDVDHAPPSGRR